MAAYAKNDGMVKAAIFQGRRQRTILVIFLLAFAVRLLYLLQFQDSPFFKFLLGDSEGYLAWGRKIADGDWLGETVFYQAPLYPYFLGIIQSVFGEDLWTIRLIQIALGSLACTFIFLAGSIFFSPLIGLVSALLACFYAPAIFFDTLIQKTGVGFFFMSLSLWLLALALQKRRPANWLLLGLVIGLFTLLRENIILIIFVLVFWPLLKFSNMPLPRRIACSGIFLLGVILILGPVSVRNFNVGGTWTLTTSQLGPNLYLGNNRHATGLAYSLRPGRAGYLYERKDATDLAEHALGRNLSPAEVSSYWFGQALGFVIKEPFQWLKLTLRKCLLLWNQYEVTDTDDYYMYHQWSNLLKFLDHLNHFGVLAPLAAVGWIFAWSMRRDYAGICYVFLIVLIVSIIPFIVFGRYRFTLIPLMILFAGCAIVQGARHLRKKSPGPLLKGMSAGLLMIVLSQWPVYSPNLSMGYRNLALAYQSGNQIQLARQSIDTALEIDPDFAEAYNFRGNLHAGSRQYKEAIHDYSKAISLIPDFALAFNNRGSALAHLGQYPEALKDYDTALQLNDRYPEAYYNRGIAFTNLGQYEEALADFNQALRINPKYADAHNNRGVVFSRLKKYAEAMKEFEEVLQLDPKHVSALINRGIAHTRQQNYEKGLQDFTEATRLQPSNSDAYHKRSKLFVMLGEFQNALKDLNQVIYLDPEQADAYEERGLLQKDIFKQETLACRDWKEACNRGKCQLYQTALKENSCQK
ncbi:MAG: tetratricopeptide repeat protein [SAR324 cluster bacterium]|nr:tetratricopeptide repeat protein [SAR324 cluster bacterium]